MSERAESSAAEASGPVTLAYEPAPRWQRPPGWVIGVVGAYLLLMAGLLALPGFAMVAGEWDSGFREIQWPLGAIVAGLAVAWVSLLWIPVRLGRRRRVSRRSLWVPIIGSGFLAALLLYGLTLTVVEWAIGVHDEWLFGWVPPAIAVAGWVAWGIVFWFASRGKTAEGFAGRLHRGVIAGSALELLVAVPAHVFVRRREECCAGIGTGVGICCGLAVMIVAFGPGVAVLYYRRVKQISGG